jgi:hypothetical protein
VSRGGRPRNRDPYLSLPNPLLPVRDCFTPVDVFSHCEKTKMSSFYDLDKLDIHLHKLFILGHRDKSFKIHTTVIVAAKPGKIVSVAQHYRKIIG